MIDGIHGICVRKSPSEVIVEVGGVDFAVNIPFTTFERIGEPGEEVSLMTYLHVREEILELYGFKDKEERELFKTLLKVSGIGPKMALAILSRFSASQLRDVVIEGDTRRLTVVKGIGGRTAERLMLELKNKLDVETIAEIGIGGGSQAHSAVREAAQALETLGFSAQQADQATRKALKECGQEASVEDLLKIALKG